MLFMDGNEFIGYKSLGRLIFNIMFNLLCTHDLYASHVHMFSKGRHYHVLEYKHSNKKDMQNAFLVIDNTQNKVWVTDSVINGHFKYFNLVIDTTSSSNGNKND